ncbi:MAG: hypothetical protein JNK74_00935 [Candidatus Hydrogenedentes bacterium]|nr:hypothetical protein [Candidatus Hydrogenedentota bacterium]
MKSSLLPTTQPAREHTPRPAAYRTQRTRSILPGETVYLDGNALLNPTAMGSGVQFAWRFARVPEGSRALLMKADTCRASFVPDVAGRYLVRLEARTPAGALRFVKEVRVSRDEMTPVAVAKAESALVMTGAPIRLSAASTENPVAGSLSYDWRITSAPAGSIAMLSYAASEDPMIFPDLEGRYEVSLSVRNAAGMGTTDTVSINVVSPRSLTRLTEVSAATGPDGLNFGRTYSAAELNALVRAVRITTRRPGADRTGAQPEIGGQDTHRTEASRGATSPRFASLVGHIRMLLRDGVDSIARQVESSHDFHQPAVSRR